ncbi:putative fungal zinc cluster transcriptionfactor [Paramicrosporidium saccamoebae]|uniref:Phosphatidylglycerol/phosphatidylinositol transfer protein n=1 Tax=Paramicrosporidium saccamoebae TaxID=1246581 RepID=A0A2H9TIF4_9FUNG|nr:putative fungal zinc cluster transcriptionfactor [Paramicrosporidium saccamoebae]
MARSSRSVISQRSDKMEAGALIGGKMSVPLLRWGIENSDADALQKEVETGTDPELIEMILGKDDPVRMKDVAKMGLWPRILPFLDSKEYELQVHAAWLMAVCAQNNQEGAEHLLSLGTVPKMLAMISADNKGPLTKKCVSVLSALFQCSENGYEQFEKQDGLAVFQQAIARFSADENLRTRIVFSLYFYVHMHGKCPDALRNNEFFYPLGGVRRRKKTNHACVFCQRSHMTCDTERPCQRCIKRRIGHLCHDAPPPTVEFAEPTPKALTYSPTEGPYQAYYSNDEFQQAFKIVDDNWEPEAPKIFDCQEIDNRMKNFSLEGRERIKAVSNALDQISQFITTNLSKEDLVRSEACEYSKIIACITTPFLVARGGGEVLRVSQTFAELMQIRKEELESGWQICELLTEEAFVNYGEKMVSLYFDQRQRSFVTNCVLVPGGSPKFLQRKKCNRSARSSGENSEYRNVRLVPCGLTTTTANGMAVFGVTMKLLLTVLLFVGVAYCKNHVESDEIVQFMRANPAGDAVELLDALNEDEPDMPKGWSNCGSSDDLFSLHSFTLTPDPPRRSQMLSVRVAGNLATPLAGGTLNYTVTFGIIPIVQDSLSLCDALALEPKIPQCPLRSGDWDVRHEVELPREVPFGKYKVRAAAWDVEGRQIFCVEGTTVIGIMMAQAKKQLEWNRQFDFDDV